MSIMFRHYRDVPHVHPPCVYVLVDPRTPNAPRYVGSSRALRDRLKGHHRPRATRNDSFDAWLADLAAAGYKPALRVLYTYGTEREAQCAEWRIQQRWMRRGVPLVSRVNPVTDESHLLWTYYRLRNAKLMQQRAA